MAEPGGQSNETLLEGAMEKSVKVVEPNSVITKSEVTEADRVVVKPPATDVFSADEKLREHW
jgi:hypothetical protein